MAEEKSITQAVTISALAGKVEVLPKDALDWKEAEIGMQLNEGDKIKTTEDGKAELIFQDGSFIRMKPNTTLGVRTLRQEVSTEVTHYNLELRVGEIMAEVQKLKKGSSFEVQTPTAVAAVRGTTYYMRTGTRIVDGVEKSFVEIYIDSDDTILFTNTVSGESCVVTQGQGAIVYDDGTMEEPFSVPAEERDAWKSGFDIVYDDSKGMRDVDEEGEGDDDDTSGDIDDTTGSQNDSQEGANQDQTGEQDITGLAKVDIIPDSDDDGYLDANDAFPFDSTEWLDTDNDGTGNNADTDDDNDGLWDLVEIDREETDPFDLDTDGDSYDDFEDAFPRDARVDKLPEGTNITKGYGSWAELREAALAIGNLERDVGDMIDDIHARGFEAAKENIFDHQAGKVMTDRWGNRVRVEEYVSKPTNKQVQVLALNLRTAGPNAGISSLDFRIKFYDTIRGSLRDLPWSDYMSNPVVEDFDWSADTKPGADDEAQLILYDEEPTNYPIEFSLKAKNPYDDSVEFTEMYSEDVLPGEIEEEGIFTTTWYQTQESADIYINDEPKYHGEYYEGWGRGWDEGTKFAFFNDFDDSWLLGIFYLINDDGTPVATGQENKDYLDEMHGVRDCINPDFNLEMVFFSSEFGRLSSDNGNSIEETGKGGLTRWEKYLYNTYRSIDVITIPEITEPYNHFND